MFIFVSHNLLISTYLFFCVKSWVTFKQLLRLIEFLQFIMTGLHSQQALSENKF